MLFELVLIVVALVLTACAGGPGEVASAPSNGIIPAQGPCDESLLDSDVLAASSDLVVRGTVGLVVESADSGGPTAAIREVEVLETLAGDAPSEELRVAFGLGDDAGERCAPVVEGRQVPLFLDDAGTDTDATHVVIGIHDNGVLTVDGDQALVRSWVPGRLRNPDPPRDDLPEDGGFPPPGFAFDLDDVLDVVVETT